MRVISYKRITATTTVGGIDYQPKYCDVQSENNELIL